MQAKEHVSSEDASGVSGFGRPRDGTPAVYFVLAHEQFAPQQLVEYGTAAERAGFEGVWASDHFQPWQVNQGHAAFAWVTLAALTQRTVRIHFGTGVTCPTFRYRPAVVAQAWASLSLLAPGRVFLGLGTGENLNEGASGGGWGPYDERAARLVEAIKIMRALWTGNDVNIKGQFWQVEGKLYDPPASPIPVYIAAGGSKSARLVGKYGDGLITGANSLRNKPEVRSAWEEGMREQGKNPESHPVIVEHWAVVGGDAEAREAAEKWRFTPKPWKPGYFDNISPKDVQTKATAEIPLESVYKNWTVSADPEVHLKAIRELASLGATHVVAHVGTQNQVEVIEFFGREVLPLMRRG
jgi:TAT-translocated FGD2 family F420-dependent dehydrogenase